MLLCFVLFSLPLLPANPVSILNLFSTKVMNPKQEPKTQKLQLLFYGLVMNCHCQGRRFFPSQFKDGCPLNSSYELKVPSKTLEYNKLLTCVPSNNGKESNNARIQSENHVLFRIQRVLISCYRFRNSILPVYELHPLKSQT